MGWDVSNRHSDEGGVYLAIGLHGPATDVCFRTGRTFHFHAMPTRRLGVRGTSDSGGTRRVDNDTPVPRGKRQARPMGSRHHGPASGVPCALRPIGLSSARCPEAAGEMPLRRLGGLRQKLFAFGGPLPRCHLGEPAQIVHCLIHGQTGHAFQREGILCAFRDRPPPDFPVTDVRVGFRQCRHSMYYIGFRPGFNEAPHIFLQFQGRESICQGAGIGVDLPST